MRNGIKVALVGAAITAVGLGFATTANATNATIGERGDMSAVNYRDELGYANIREYTWQAQTLGPSVCSYREQGYTEDALIGAEEGAPGYYKVEQSVAIVMGAEWHFCPEYFGHQGLPSGPPSPASESDSGPTQIV